MADTRTKDQTRTGPAPMREQGMPPGQAPARQEPPRRETAMEARAREREEAKRKFLQAVAAKQGEIERLLMTYDIPLERFLGALEIGLNNAVKADEDFCTKVRPAAFVREVMRAAHIGLMPDGKQAAIAPFKGDCSLMPMVEGYVEIIWKTGLTKDINHNVVCEGDDFDFEEGDSGWVSHKRNLKRAANAEAIGAWCVINLNTGGRLVEVVDQVDLRKIAAVSKAGSGPRKEWEREMHRKAPFRRLVKRMPKTERLSLLIQIDDSNVDLERLNAPADEAPGHGDIFGNRPIRSRRKKAPPEQAALPAPDESQLAPVIEEAGVEESVDTPDATPPEDDQPFVLRAVITTKNGVQHYEPNELGAELWFGDLQQKMKVLSGEQLQAFWRQNQGFIREAGANGHTEAAMKLMALAKDFGLTGGEQ